MQDDDEQVRRVFETVHILPPDPSTVDITRAIETGKRRRRVRRLRLGVMSVSLSVVAVIAVPYALQADLGRTSSALTGPTVRTSATSSPKPVEKPFQPRQYDRPAPRALPASCQGSALPVPGGGIKSYISNIDPSGRFVTGRRYDPATTPVLWRDGKATAVPFGGDDDNFESANAKGDAVGSSYPESGERAQAYVGGVLHELKGGSGQATGINNQGKISGYLGQGLGGSKPVYWPSATAEPVALPIPEGFRSAKANDIDEDGTIVGQLGESGGRIAYVWYPDGAGYKLPAPVYQGKPVDDFDARSISKGWVTGYLAGPAGGMGVRWDLTTGKVDVLDQIQWSNDVDAHGWIVGMDRQDDAIVTDGVSIFKLKSVFPKPADYGMNWGQAISDDGMTIVGLNDDKNHDGEQRGVIWKCR